METTLETKRIYELDPYANAFEATVVAEKPGWVALDQTVFYPEGGGQPADHGKLNEISVSDTQLDDADVIWHKVAEPIAIGTKVSGQIDWLRRFDHMQQHSGQHVLSQAFWRLFEAATVGFHLGEQQVTIDVDQSDLTREQLEEVESLANAVIRRGLLVTTQVVDPKELPVEELRKLPKVNENIRLVGIGDFDLCGCGGTHVRDLGEVGLLKILATEKRRGNLRVYFVCGQRAYQDYASKHQSLVELSNLLSQPVNDVVPGVVRSLERLTELEKELKQLREELLGYEAEKLFELKAGRVVVAELGERSLDEAKQLANLLIAQPETAVALGLPGDTYRLVVAASADLGLHAGNLLKGVVSNLGGKGGGAPSLAQGAVPGERGKQALEALKGAIE